MNHPSSIDKNTMTDFKCVVCDKLVLQKFGCNPDPFSRKGDVCDSCDTNVILVMRIWCSKKHISSSDFRLFKFLDDGNDHMRKFPGIGRSLTSKLEPN
jgi:hypothetical protein